MAGNDLYKFTKIIVPLDGSKIAERALKYAVSLANVFNAEIVVVSVVSTSKKSTDPFRSRLEEISPEMKEKLEDMSASLLMETYHDITLDAIRKCNIKVKCVLKSGDLSVKSVISILLNLIQKERANLIVLASSRKTGFQRFKKGSVTEELIKVSPIPVLVVKK